MNRTIYSDATTASSVLSAMTQYGVQKSFYTRGYFAVSESNY